MYSKRIIDKSLADAEARVSRRLGDPSFRLKEYPVAESIQRTVDLEKAYMRDGTPKRRLSDEETEFILNEITVSKLNFQYWAERYCMVVDNAGKLRPFKLRPSQLKILQKWAELEDAAMPLPRGKIALVIVKARRVGATLLSLGALSHAVMLHQHYNALEASDIPERSLENYRTLTRIYDHLPPWMKPSMSGRVKADHLHFNELDSSLEVGTGNQKNPIGQGVQRDFIHLTEVATWEPAFVGQIDDDIMPAFLSSQTPTSLWVLESTGKGMHPNWFYEQYTNAKLKKGIFRSLFVSWFDAPEVWSMPAEGVEFRPRTQEMATRVERDYGVVLTREQLAYYQVTREQYEEKQRLEDFLQEMPSTEEEAFQSGYRSVWSIEVRDRIRNGVRPLAGAYMVDVKKKKFQPVPQAAWHDLQFGHGAADGAFLIYEAPRKGFLYTVGVDASYGEANARNPDSSAIEVVRVGNKHAPDEQVAEWWGTIDPIALATVCDMAGKFFTDRIEGLPAKMAIEVNPGSPGLITQTELIRMGYPHWYVWKKLNTLGGGYTNQIGWYTTPSTRPLLTKMGVKYINEDNLKVNSLPFLKEMGDFVRHENRIGREHLAHRDGAHDDRIMALFIALYVAHEDDQVIQAEERRKLMEAKSEKRPPSQYQRMGMTWEEVMTHWEYGEGPAFPDSY